MTDLVYIKLRTDITSMESNLRLHCHLVNAVWMPWCCIYTKSKEFMPWKILSYHVLQFKGYIIINETNESVHWSRRVFAGASRSDPHGCRPMPTDPSLRQNVRVATTGSASLETGHLPVTQHEQICEIYTFFTRHKQQLQCNSECYKKVWIWGKQTNVLFSIKTVNERKCIDDRK